MGSTFNLLTKKLVFVCCLSNLIPGVKNYKLPVFVANIGPESKSNRSWIAHCNSMLFYLSRHYHGKQDLLRFDVPCDEDVV